MKEAVEVAICADLGNFRRRLERFRNLRRLAENCFHIVNFQKVLPQVDRKHKSAVFQNDEETIVDFVLIFLRHIGGESRSRKPRDERRSGDDL